MINFPFFKIQSKIWSGTIKLNKQTIKQTFKDVGTIFICRVVRLKDVSILV